MTQPKNTTCIACSNANCFIKACSPEWLRLISKKKVEVKYRKRQNIFIPEHLVFGLYFIKNGKVKVTATGWNEKEQIVRLATDGHILGHRGYGKETYPIGATALEESVICFVDNDTIYEAFMKNPNLTYNLMLFYSSELRAVEERMKGMAQMTVPEKVAYALLYLKDVFGYDDRENVLNINITRADIAALAGISEEQVVRTLTAFEKEKLIAKVKRKIRILKMEKLQDMINLYI